MDLAGRKDYMYILIQPWDAPHMIFLQVINWATGDSNRFLICSTVHIGPPVAFFFSFRLQGSALNSAKSAITDDHFLIHSTWDDRVEIAFYDLEIINSPLTRTSTIPLEPKYSHTFSFTDGHVSVWTRVDTVWDDRICTAEIQLQDSNTQILTLAVLDVSPSGEESHRTLRCLIRFMESPYGNHIFHSGRNGKILMWPAYPNKGEESGDFVIEFAGRPGLADIQDEDCREMRVMRFIPPDFVHKHGSLYDLDFDDGNGRLALYMEDGTIFIFEFI